MINFCGYNFCGDLNALDPLPTNVSNIKELKIHNSIYNHMNISRNTNVEFNTKTPVWDLNTIMDCDFNGDIYAGNVNFTLSQLTSVKIKRRKKGEFEWVTIKDIPIDSYQDLNTVLKDYFVPSYEEFEYSAVPILNGIEGEYIIGTVSSEFNGVFISDVTKNFKLDKNVSYGNRSSIQEIGQLTPLGSKYPIVIKNGKTDYEVGSVSGMLLGENYDNTHEINRKDIVDHINEFKDFLKNGKPKMIRDWNGSIYLVHIVGNPSISYNNAYGMGIANTTFEWIEQGKYDNEEDLYSNGFIEITI